MQWRGGPCRGSLRILPPANGPWARRLAAPAPVIVLCGWHREGRGEGPGSSAAQNLGRRGTQSVTRACWTLPGLTTVSPTAPRYWPLPPTTGLQAGGRATEARGAAALVSRGRAVCDMLSACHAEQCSNGHSHIPVGQLGARGGLVAALDHKHVVLGGAQLQHLQRGGASGQAGGRAGKSLGLRPTTVAPQCVQAVAPVCPRSTHSNSPCQARWRWGRPGRGHGRWWWSGPAAGREAAAHRQLRQSGRRAAAGACHLPSCPRWRR